MPSLLFSTKYNFVYAACDGAIYEYPYGCDSYTKTLYTVENNQLVVHEVNPAKDSDKDGTPDINEQYKVRLFVHDTQLNGSREITPEEAQQMKFSTLLTSPDDVTISSGYSSGSGFFLFDGGSSYGQYLLKGNLRSRLNLIHDDRYYSQEIFHFIGWILE